jgi:serine/threonine protein kinase
MHRRDCGPWLSLPARPPYGSPMPPPTGRNGQRSSAGRNGQGYDTPRWEDARPLIPGGRKGFIRKATERGTGRECVLKHASGNRRRFYEEAVNMQRLNETPGILPVLDVDDTQPGRPALYAMLRARLLGDGLGDNATLRDVVRVVAFLADVLARLAKEGTYHRDIKPANLFWWDGGPALADFELSAISADLAQIPTRVSVMVYCAQSWAICALSPRHAVYSTQPASRSSMSRSGTA